MIIVRRLCILITVLSYMNRYRLRVVLARNFRPAIILERVITILNPCTRLTQTDNELSHLIRRVVTMGGAKMYVLCVYCRLFSMTIGS